MLTDSSFLQRIDPRLAAPFLNGFTESMTLAFLVAACVMAVGFVLVLFIKELPLRTMSGAQAAIAEEAERVRAEAAESGEQTAAIVGNRGDRRDSASRGPTRPPGRAGRCPASGRHTGDRDGRWEPRRTGAGRPRRHRGRAPHGRDRPAPGPS